jgi:diguanylate cyclase (GGDEF)-like protein
MYKNVLNKKNKDYDIDSIKLELSQQKNIISKLLSLIRISSIIISSLDIKQVLKSILEQSKILMDCHKSSVLLVDENTNQLYFEYLANEEEREILKDIRLNKGEGIAGSVWEMGKSILVEDASKDNRFSDKADQKLSSKTETLIASPLIVNGNVIGVMEAINKKNALSFNEFDLQIFETLANHASSAIYNARLYEMAITDGMTKLFIHKYFQGRLAEEFKRAERYKRDLSLIMIDLDHFKRLNDKYGHQFGDEVLIKTANEIKAKCRASDLPCRYGGEEFAIILPETNMKSSMALAERLRKNIAKLKLKYSNETVNYTLSAGVSSIKENKPVDVKDFIKMADRALYFSKQNGRNQVTAYNK